MKNKLIAALSALLLTSASVFASTLKPVDNLDIDRYQGTWYEIAKIPNIFQEMCVGNTTANYQIQEDGYIKVTNRCKTDEGKMTEVKGKAKIEDENQQAKLKVSFVKLMGVNLLWGDYWVIGLDEDYQYTIVGHPDREYGWILSRTENLSKYDLNKVYEILEQNGYDPNDFESTKHSSS